MPAPTVTTNILEDDLGITAIFTGTYADGTQETAVKKIDASTLKNLLPGVTAPHLSIESIDWTCSGAGVVNVLWDATTPLLAISISAMGYGKHNDAPLSNTARGTAGFTGDVLFTTTGFVAAGTYSVTIHFRKDYGFTLAPTVVSNLVTDALAGAYITGDVMQITLVADQIVYPDYRNSGVVVFDADGSFRCEYVQNFADTPGYGTDTEIAPSEGSGTDTLVLQHKITEDNHGETGDVTFEHVLGIRGSNMGNAQIFDTLVSVDTSAFTINPAATVTSVAVTDAHSGVYITGDVVLLEATMSQAVKVSGVPTIPLTMTSGNKNALFTGYGSDHTKLEFAYTVVAADISDVTTFDVTGDMGVTGASVQNANANVDVIPTLAASNTAAFYVNQPVVALVAGTGPRYDSAETVSFTVTYSVNATVAAGTPTIPIVIPTGNKVASYASGSGTNVLTFSYTPVVIGDIAAAGTVSVTGLIGGTGTIKNGTRFLGLTFKAPSMAAVSMNHA